LSDTNTAAHSDVTVATTPAPVTEQKEIPAAPAPVPKPAAEAKPFIIHQESANNDGGLHPVFTSYQAIRPTYYKAAFEDTHSEDGREKIIAARIQFNDDDEEAITVKEPERAHTVIGETKTVHYSAAEEIRNPFANQKIPLSINTNPDTSKEIHPDNIIDLKNK
jgi:hypothetical protein